MLQAIIFSIINGSSLVLGASVGVLREFKQSTVAAFMAFASGVLICALTFGLMENAFNHGGFDAVIIGFLAGGLVFIVFDHLIHRRGARKHAHGEFNSYTKDTNGLLIVSGSILDGIPESIAIGITLFIDRDIGFMLMAAVFIANFPESISSVAGLKKEGFSRKRILIIWISVGIVVALTTFFSFLFLGHLDNNILGILEALAAGAILAMLADSTMPEAYEDGGYSIGILTVLGFLLAFVISRL